MDIETTIKARRINYLYYLCKGKENEMLFQFFSTQWKYPTNKQDWTELVREDLRDFEIPIDLEFIKSKGPYAFKNFVKSKSKEYAWKKFMRLKIGHSKLDDLWYAELKLQDYLNCNKFTTEEARTLFSFRTRMAKFEENYKNGRSNILCPLCQLHFDTQALAFQCPKVRAEINVKRNYDEIFKSDISKELAKTLTEILKFRTRFLEERMVQ